MTSGPVAIAANQITASDGKGSKERVTVSPQIVDQPLREALGRARMVRESRVADGCCRLAIPNALLALEDT